MAKVIGTGIGGSSPAKTFKTWEVYFDEVDRGFKRFEIRRLNQAPKVGERIRLIEHVQMEDGSTGVPTGRSLDVIVSRPVIYLGALDPNLAGYFAFSITLPQKLAIRPNSKGPTKPKAEIAAKETAKAMTRRPSNPFVHPRCTVPGCSRTAWHLGKCFEHYPKPTDRP